MEQAFNFKLTSGERSSGLSDSQDGWMARESSWRVSRAEWQRRSQTGGTESFSGGQREPSTLQACASANLSCWHRPSLPGGEVYSLRYSSAHPPPPHQTWGSEETLKDKP